MVLKVKKLSVIINKHQVLTDLNFELPKAKITGLLGANGAGKTTTFKSLIGLHKISKGSIYINNNEITHLPMHKRAQLGIGYLSQEASIFRELTVEENLLIYLELQNLTKEEKQTIVSEKLKELNILSLKKRLAKELSGGQRKRVEIARSLITNPKILFLDEPFANVDPKTIEDLKSLIIYLKSKGITIFITDHNAHELLSLIDEGLFLQDGKILSWGTADQLVNNQFMKEHYLGHNFSTK